MKIIKKNFNLARRSYMKRFFGALSVFMILIFVQISAQAQTTGSVAGTVLDQNGAFVPNATVVVKGQSGQEFTVTTNEGGEYRIPAVENGLYTITITAKGFKKSITTNVKI